MKKIGLFFLVLLLVSCNSKVKKEDIPKLNGYWEINQVTFSTGDTKDYKINETIDYFELRQANLDNKVVGFKQKVMPQFDGKFKTNNIKEAFKIIKKDNSFFIEYTTKFGKREEEIVELQDAIFTIKNKDNVSYTYKKFKPFLFK